MAQNYYKFSRCKKLRALRWNYKVYKLIIDMSHLSRYLKPVGWKDVMLHTETVKRFCHLSLSVMSSMKSGPLFLLKYVADVPHRLLRCFHSATHSDVLCCTASMWLQHSPSPYSERIYLLRWCYNDDEMDIAQSRDKIHIESIANNFHRTLR